MVDGENHCSQGTDCCCQYKCDHISGKHKLVEETVGHTDLEELLDKRERAGALVLWLSCEGQTDVWEMFSDNFCLSAILVRQGLPVAATIDLRTKKAESFSPQLLHFWHKLKKKNPKIVAMAPTVDTKRVQKERSGMATVPLVHGRGRTSNSWRKTLPDFWTRIRKDLVVGKGAISTKKSTTADGPSCVARNPNGFFTISEIFCVHWS